MEVRAKIEICTDWTPEAQLVADLIRGKGSEDGSECSHVYEKERSQDHQQAAEIGDCERRSNKTIDVDRLYVKKITVDQGPTMKRFMRAPLVVRRRFEREPATFSSSWMRNKGGRDLGTESTSD